MKADGRAVAHAFVLIERPAVARTLLSWFPLLPLLPLLPFLFPVCVVVLCVVDQRLHVVHHSYFLSLIVRQ